MVTENQKVATRWIGAMLAIGLALGFGAAPMASTRQAPLVFHATSSGKQTLDQGEGGGNPFASALIDILRRPTVKLGELPAALRDLTHEKSRGFQTADVPVAPIASRWQVLPSASGERRIALVLIVSDYSRSGGAPSLPGARHDGERVRAALEAAGFATRLELDLDADGMQRTLAQFSAASEHADAAAIYTTGHGVERAGVVYLIPGDYPIAQRNGALATRAVPLSDIRSSLKARHVNLLFYGGCRDDPLGD